MVEPKAISGFWENLPEQQLVEEKFKEIIKKNYSNSGFTPLDTPVVERLEALTAKWADDNEIYGVHRINGESEDAQLGLRFDLTVPFARYVSQHQGVLAFPFKRQHIARVYRWERPQKGRYREFYQADVDIIWNETLSLFADVEVLSTIYNSLKDLNFWEFVMHINNKKFLAGYLSSLGIQKIPETISVIDKKDKVKSIVPMLEDLETSTDQIENILEFIKNAEIKTSNELLELYKDIDHELFQEGIWELKYVYSHLLQLWVDEKFIKINPAISRGLNYYTGTVFETFISGAENMWSVSSGGRYENLCGNFTDKPFPGVWGSIGLSRIIAVLQHLKNPSVETFQKTTTQVLVLNMDENLLFDTLDIVKNLREKNIPTEIYLQAWAKFKKQFKYADNKKIPFVVIFGEDEKEKWIVQIKKLETWEQKEAKIAEIAEIIQSF